MTEEQGTILATGNLKTGEITVKTQEFMTDINTDITTPLAAEAKPRLGIESSDALPTLAQKLEQFGFVKTEMPGRNLQ